MNIGRANGRLVNVLLILLVIAGSFLVYYVIILGQAPPAVITPRLVQVGSGQTASITVSWSAPGESVPYTVYLYESPTGSSCGTSNTLLSAKTGLPTPGYTFTTPPLTGTTYFCGTVAGSKGSSAVSPIATATVSPPLTTPSVTLSPSGIDAGQVVVLTATVKWTQGISPYTVALYVGTNITCAYDTTTATVVSGSNPMSSLTGTTATFSVKDPGPTPSQDYYCATVTDSASTPHTVTSFATPFTISQAPSTTITPDAPIIDSGQNVTLTAVPAHGTYPYLYQWYAGQGCGTGNQIAGATSVSYTTAKLTTIGPTLYSVEVTDSSPGSPPASACDNVIVAVSSSFAGSTVTVTPSSSVLDNGQSELVFAAWSKAGTLPYQVQLYSSSSASCQGAVPVGLPTVLSKTTTNFTVSPTTSTYYCVTVQDGAFVPESAAISTSVLVTVNPAFVPTFSLSPVVIDTGQAATVTAKVAWTGGTSPYSVTLYSGTSAACESDTTKVIVSAGSNPQQGVTGTSVTWSFAAPASSTYYCAIISDSATTPQTTYVPVIPKGQKSAPAVEFTVNPSLAASIEPAAPIIIDNGSSITLIASPSGGTPSYHYQWYSGSSCPTGHEISGQVASSSIVKPLSTTSYSVLVTDSSTGTPAAQFCAGAGVTVNPALDPTLTILPLAIDTSQTTTLTASASWTGGTSSYTVTLYSGTSTTCALDTSVVKVLSGTNPQTGVIGTSAVFSFTSPTTNTEYCVSVKDSATVPVTVLSKAVLFTVNPAMSTPNLVLSLTAIDTGQTATLKANLTWTGGTSPYTATLYSGTSSSCSSDKTLVAVILGENPQTDLASDTTFSLTAPSSSTYYCATVVDSSVVSVPISSSAASFTVNPALTAKISPPSEAVDSGQSFAVTLTAVPSGGTSPYLYQWYKSSGCSGSSLLGQTSSSFSPGVLTSSATYSVNVIDSSSGSPAASACATVTVIVNPALSTPTITLTPATITTSYSGTITAAVTWSGGTSPYSVTLYSGISSTCSYDTTVVGTKTDVVGTSTTFSLTAPFPTLSTYYCAVVTDSAPVPVTTTTVPALLIVNPSLTVTISPASPTIDSGQSVTLSATPSSGVSPYYYQWYTNSSCSVAISGATSSSYPASPLSTHTFSVEVTDSATPVPDTACTAVTVTVNTAFAGTPVTVSPSAVLDIGQSVTLTVSWSRAGTPTYTVLLETSSTTSCSSPVPFESQTGESGTSATFTVTPTSSTYYCAKVTDSALSPESTSTTASDLVSVASPVLSAPSLGLSPPAIDTGQTATVTATVTWSGGASPYTVVLESGTSSSCASDTKVVTVSGSNPQSGVTGTSTTFSFQFSGSTEYFCATVTDSATTAVSATSQSAVLTVNAALTALISPASPTIDFGQSVSLTAAPSGGTLGYHYQWYSGSACTTAISGQTASSYPTGPLDLNSSFSVLVTDSSPGLPGASYCAHVAVTVDPALSATISPASPVIDSGQSITLKAVASGGTPYYFYHWYSGSGCSPSDALASQTSASYFTGPLTAGTSFSVNVTDSSVGSPAASYCASVTVTVNPALTAPVISTSVTSVSPGGSSTLSTTTSFGGGTSPYSCQWLVEAPGATSFTALGAAFPCTPTPLLSTSTGALSTAGTWEFELKVTDSSAGTPNTIYSNVVDVSVS